MDIRQLQKNVADIKIWKKGDSRAPHKPLLLLYVLSLYKQNHPRLFNYGAEIHEPLLELLNRFGPQRDSHNPHMPFWRLKGDGFWQLENAEQCTNPKRESKEPAVNTLIKHNVLGGLNEEAYQLLAGKPDKIDELAQQILNQHFPDSVQEVIAHRLDFPLAEINKKRDPKFRQMVLRAYNYKCAVCGYDLRQDSIPVGLEAAHIKWKQYGGPCMVNNGLALCSLHHSAFDVGAIGLDSSLNILVSEGVNGNDIVQKLFWDFKGRPVSLPKEQKNYPHDSFVEWHLREVFRQ